MSRTVDETTARMYTPFRGFDLASPLAIHPDLSPRSDGYRTTPDHIETYPRTLGQGRCTTKSQVPPTPLAKNHTGTRSQRLEDYIAQKKQAYLCFLQQEADLARQRARHAQEWAEEQIVEELTDSGRNILPLGEGENCRHGDTVVPLREREDVTPSATASPLVLEASTLFELLPPLQRSSTESPHNAANSDGKRSAARNPRYYPYLASKKPAQEHWETEVTAGDVPDRQNHEGENQSIKNRQTGVVGFHSSGYGAGWADFKACADWICLVKRTKP